MAVTPTRTCTCSAVIEHTNRVVFLEDDDVASVKDGCLTLHRVHRAPIALRRTQIENGVSAPPVGSTPNDHRAIATLNMVLADIMKGRSRPLPLSLLCLSFFVFFFFYILQYFLLSYCLNHHPTLTVLVHCTLCTFGNSTVL